MIDAVVNDLKLSETQSYENSSAVADMYVNAFIKNEKWTNRVSFLEDLKNISKEELVAFANDFYKNNYVVTYKRKGDDPNLVKVENPGISPVNLNRDKSSDFINDFNAMKSSDLKPQFVDYKKDILSKKLDNGIEVSYINNTSNDLF
jgi:hypothetical protein